ncbi:hypothetical protein BV25DRAFT_1821872 [Artomyces pyxidatus]|uniref:Uncharacterized protein n=1 Tax=Artomyces pyxidatus TaxID=48021 RepID=A0ACB8T969_9AGAM|nr:hypothetical protein BV25DRAFT_1821872 [Artomyces pyxidatus]
MSEQDPLLPAHDGADVEAAQYEGPGKHKSLRERVAYGLESSAIHKLVIALIVIDAACVLADLSYTLLEQGCEGPSDPGSPIWLEVLSNISTTITTIFLVEIPLTIWSLGFQFYVPRGPVPHASLHLFDATIIITTFVLEVVLRGRERELAGLLIILRLWRLLKLVGGVAVGAGELEDETVKELAQVKRELNEKHTELAQVKDDNQQLRARLAALQPNDPDAGQ